jgi:hypothetical protein
MGGTRKGGFRAPVIQGKVSLIVAEVGRAGESVGALVSGLFVEQYSQKGASVLPWQRRALDSR